MRRICILGSPQFCRRFSGFVKILHHDRDRGGRCVSLSDALYGGLGVGRRVSASVLIFAVPLHFRAAVGRGAAFCDEAMGWSCW